MDMIEKVARAMWEANKPYSDTCSWDVMQSPTHLTAEAKDSWRGMARAALLAMREPTNEMLVGAGAMEGFDADIESADICHVNWWQAMIDTTLKTE